MPEYILAVPTFQYLSSAKDFYTFGTEFVISQHTANLYHLIPSVKDISMLDVRIFGFGRGRGGGTEKNFMQETCIIFTNRQNTKEFLKKFFL